MCNKNKLLICLFSGANGTVDGQGAVWWDWFHNHTLNYTRPPLVELMYSTRVVISNLTFINSPFWNIHPVYCRFLSRISSCHLLLKHRFNRDGNYHPLYRIFPPRMNSQVLVQHLTILAPISSPNTDGIDPGVRSWACYVSLNSFFKWILALVYVLLACLLHLAVGPALSKNKNQYHDS